MKLISIKLVKYLSGILSKGKKPNGKFQTQKIEVCNCYYGTCHERCSSCK